MSDIVRSVTFEIPIAPRPKQRRALSRLRAALRVARAGDRLRAAKERGRCRWWIADDWGMTCTSDGLRLHWRISEPWA